jgi:hypothetical protein
MLNRDLLLIKVWAENHVSAWLTGIEVQYLSMLQDSCKLTTKDRFLANCRSSFKNWNNRLLAILFVK